MTISDAIYKVEIERVKELCKKEKIEMSDANIDLYAKSTAKHYENSIVAKYMVTYANSFLNVQSSN